ncbi:MAG: universal stress protein [Chloroflexota bacterium]
MTTLARSFNSEVILLSVPVGSTSESYSETIRGYLDNLAGELESQGLKVRTLVTGSAAAQTIVATAETEMVDLIMVATHGRSGMDRFMLGSVAERVVHNMPCPIFLLPVRDALETAEETLSEGIVAAKQHFAGR